MKMKRLLSLMRQAIDDYGMIKKNDKIAIGLSGGKDSLSLLYGLKELQNFYPVPFELHAVTVDLGYQNLSLDRIKKICSDLQIDYTIVPTDIAQIIFQERKESNPCSLCAKMRKGALNEAMMKIHCNKIAYAHHKDDVLETMLLSLLYEGRLHTFDPVTCLEETGLTVIRPLIYIYEAEIKGFIHKYEIPVVKSPCPVDGYTKRSYVKTLLQTINRENPGVKQRMFGAIQRSKLEGWCLPDESKHELS